MSLTSSKPNSLRDELSLQEIPSQDRRARQAGQLRLLWDHRQLLSRATVIGLLFSGLLAFTIPKSYTSTAQLMPPDSQSNSGLAIMASLAARGAGGLGSMAADLFGLNSTGALFIGILRSDAAQSRLVEQFDLKKVYGARLDQDARAALDVDERRRGMRMPKGRGLGRKDARAHLYCGRRRLRQFAGRHV